MPNDDELEGRIPFRLRVGVTGHGVLERTDELGIVVRAQLNRIACTSELLPLSTDTPIRLVAVSQLAEGADRLLVREIEHFSNARGEPLQLEVILPWRQEICAPKVCATAESHAEFERYLTRAAWISAPQDGDGASDEKATRVAGWDLASRCDVLIALWHGRAGFDADRTAEILLEATWRGKPCIWVDVDAPENVLDNLGAESAQVFYDLLRARAAVKKPPPLRALVERPALQALHEAYRSLAQFNRAQLATDLERMRREKPGKPQQQQPWVGYASDRASFLAARYQWRFRWCSLCVPVFASMAAAVFAFSVFSSNRLWAVGEVLLLLAAGALFRWVRHHNYHARWLSYRLLAERLRTARYLAPTGVDYARTIGLDGVYVGYHSAEWITRACEQVWSNRPHPRESVTRSFAELQSHVAQDWIGGQIDYHRDSCGDHEKAERIYARLTAAALVLTVVVAVIHALDLHALEWMHSDVIWASIVVPTVGASLAALATLRQHRALAQRSAQMQLDLAVAQRSAYAADTVQELDAASEDAARIMAGESGDWLGVMWFLDVENV